jgi:putative inorganic carbon (hco3(-)) transporter
MPAKMTLAWLAVYWGGLIAAFGSTPVYGLLVYLFEYYLRPALHWWGKDLPNWRYSLIASLVVVVTYVTGKSKLPELRPSQNPAMRWLILFGGIMLLVTPIAVNFQESLDASLMFWKMIALYAFIIAILRTEWAFNAFVAVHIFGAGWWGWEAWNDPERDASRLLNVGSSDTLNDNQAAGHLLTVLPFVMLFALTAKDRRLRWLAIVAGVFIVNVFILCNSRGATVGLVAALAATLLLARSGHRLRMAGVSVVVAAAFLFLADPEFITRQMTTLNYEEESTAQGRLSNWGSAMRLLADYPFGAGGYGYNELSPKYAPQVTDGRATGKISPHNTWILIAAEWGVAGFIVYLGFIAATFRLLHRVRAECTDDITFYRSLAIQIGLIGTLAAGTFSDRLYGESIYWLCALAVVVYRIHRDQRETSTPLAVERSADECSTQERQAFGPAARTA